jgi:hypothetical protein
MFILLLYSPKICKYVYLPCKVSNTCTVNESEFVCGFFFFVNKVNIVISVYLY